MAATKILVLVLTLIILKLSVLQRYHSSTKTFLSIQGISDSDLLENNNLGTAIFSKNVRVVSNHSRYGLIRRTITTWTKHGFLVLKPKEHEVCLDLCICMDVEVNPGPEVVGTDCESKAENCTDKNRDRKYTRRDLLSFRKLPKSIPNHVVENLKALGLFRYRGSRGGRNLLDRRIKLRRGISESAKESHIPVIQGMRRTVKHFSRGRSPENLIPIVRQPQNLRTTSRSFAVPKFLFINICIVLAKLKIGLGLQ